MLNSPNFRRWLDHALHTHDTPQRTAAAYALGRVLRVLAIARAAHRARARMRVHDEPESRGGAPGIYSNLPWILPAYYTVATMAGARMLRAKVPPDLLRDLSSALAEASWADFRHIAHALTPLAKAFALGSTLGAILLALIAYRVALTMVLAHRRRLAHQQSQDNQ